MKKKKWAAVSLIIILCIAIPIITIYFCNCGRDINKLIYQLENAINKHDIEKIIALYPDYCKEKATDYFSQDKLDDFYNNVIINGGEDIKIQILYTTSFDISSCDNIMKQIASDYHQDIIIEDYQKVVIKYHEDFGESSLQVIKINGDYYLYFYGHIGEPLDYFH